MNGLGGDVQYINNLIAYPEMSTVNLNISECLLDVLV